MSQFRTSITPLKGYTSLIDHSRPVIMLGSCFTDNVGKRLTKQLFNCVVNPFGTLYNPASIAGAMLDLLYERTFTRDELFEHEGRWHSWNHHSRFSHPDPDIALEMMNKEAAEARKALKSASTLIITFGTAYMWRHKDTNRVVANCHKLPAADFSRELLTPVQIASLWKKILRELGARFPDLRVIFTVSPIRHLAQGAHNNQLSKSTLLMGVDRIVTEFPDKAIYFPSYEIMMDDLRDYRFYASDMVHPSDVAVDYIYDIFAESFMTDATRRLAADCEKLFRRISHRPLTADQTALDRNRAEVINAVNEFMAAHPEVKEALQRLSPQ